MRLLWLLVALVVTVLSTATPALAWRGGGYGGGFGGGGFGGGRGGGYGGGRGGGYGRRW